MLLNENKLRWNFLFSATARTVGHLSKSAEVMKLVNGLMKAPEVAATMQEFSKEMTKVFFPLVIVIFLPHLNILFN